MDKSSIAETGLFQCCRGQDNVMGIEACIREKDRVVMVMPYFEHDKFQVRLQVVDLLKHACICGLHSFQEFFTIFTVIAVIVSNGFCY